MASWLICQIGLEAASQLESPGSFGVKLPEQVVDLLAILIGLNGAFDDRQKLRRTQQFVERSVREFGLVFQLVFQRGVQPLLQEVSLLR